MYTTQEKQAFSERLKVALSAAVPKLQTVNEVATQFNLRHKKRPVSNAAVHHWMTGQAIPKIYNLETLAQWLNVSVEWLRTGKISEHKPSELSSLEYMLLERFGDLSDEQKELLIKLIDQIKAAAK